MTRLPPRLLIAVTLPLTAGSGIAAESLPIGATSVAPLFDGRCDQEEWRPATVIDLPAGVSLRFMHDRHSLFVCAEGKAQDHTVIDIYIEDAATGRLHNLHASAQLGERVFNGDSWSESEFWNNRDWGGFWVPYAGQEETDSGPRTQFLKGSHREIQILRRRFAGESWNLMVVIGAVFREDGSAVRLSFPDDGVATDASTWRRIAFSNRGHVAAQIGAKHRSVAQLSLPGGEDSYGDTAPRPSR
ncbi:hypothetical protein [Pseudomarimonas salicorniae]|uniref:Carbohydrate family 9 binding domain-like n=1 Tax=Pseudomarimonas salicorniae TaxID=2933270 RepID=A0ABT0GEG2_9GAMM|nr:hypothetical protein [Lysobacter sp. CAU 1642]MCK7592940.1 hypothetical protein [Lysobacter sp. CAU 1642]